MVLDSKSDLECHSRSFVLVPFDNSQFPISLPWQVATMYLSCTASNILSVTSDHLERSCNPEHIPYGTAWAFHLKLDNVLRQLIS